MFFISILWLAFKILFCAQSTNSQLTSISSGVKDEQDAVNSTLPPFREWVMISNCFLAICWLLSAQFFQNNSIDNQHKFVPASYSLACGLLYAVGNVLMFKTTGVYTQLVIEVYLREDASGHITLAHRLVLQFLANTFAVANIFNLGGGIIAHVFCYLTNRNQLLVISFIFQIMSLLLFAAVSATTVYLYDRNTTPIAVNTSIVTIESTATSNKPTPAQTLDAFSKASDLPQNPDPSIPLSPISIDITTQSMVIDSVPQNPAQYSGFVAFQEKTMGCCRDRRYVVAVFCAACLSVVGFNILNFILVCTHVM